MNVQKLLVRCVDNLVLIIFYGFYYGKSPLNHRLGQYLFLLFPNILGKAKIIVGKKARIAMFRCKFQRLLNENVFSERPSNLIAFGPPRAWLRSPFPEKKNGTCLFGGFGCFVISSFLCQLKGPCKSHQSDLVAEVAFFLV